MAARRSEPVGEHAAGRAGADDDVVESRRFLGRWHGLPRGRREMSSILIALNRKYTFPHAPRSGGIRTREGLRDQVRHRSACNPARGPAFITGRGRFVDDIDLPMQCHGVVVMSPHAHARIKRIDTAKAKAAPGVLAVLTGADVTADVFGAFSPVMPEDMGGPKGYRTLRSILAIGKVRALGERVAFVVAETLFQAKNAAELVDVDYEPLPAVANVEDAVKPGAPAVWDEAPNNVAVGLMMGNKEAVDAAFANAKHVVTLKLINSRVSANTIEPRAALGQYHPDSESYTLYSTTQNPHGTRQHVAGNVLKITESKLRVISPDVGGGFGMKNGGYPEDALVVWASRRVGGRPVKWVSTRSEAFVGDAHGRDQVVTGELALDDKGKILGLRVNALHQMGSQISKPASSCRSTRSSSRPASTIFPRCSPPPKRC